MVITLVRLLRSFRLHFSVRSCRNEILRETRRVNHSHLCLQGSVPTIRTEAAFQITWAAKILPTGQKDGQSVGIITEWCLKWSRNISEWSCCSNWDSTGEHWNVSMFRAIEVGDGLQNFPWANELIFPLPSILSLFPLPFLSLPILLSGYITICFYSAFLTHCQACQFP